jgi:predicted flap endonuclease-1-like 5' DNA nuclease
VATPAETTPEQPPTQDSEPLDEIAEADLEELEPTLPRATERTTVSGRVSAPPPLPIDARRASVPSAPPQSGMYRISNSPPPPAPVEAEVSSLRQRSHELQAELHQRITQIDRLRLAITLRDDRLGELERAITSQRERADELERALADERGRAERLERELASTRERVQDAALEPCDDFRRISGIGPVFARAIAAHGITTFAQLGALDAEKVLSLAAALGIPVRRIERGQWVAKAAELARVEPA